MASVELPPIAPASITAAPPNGVPAGAAAPGGTVRLPTMLTGARWRYVIITQPAMIYNPLTKQNEWSATRANRQFKQVHLLTLGTDGRYLRELDAEDYNRSEISRIVERGTYLLLDGAVAFRPAALEEGTVKKGGPIALRAGRAPVAYTWRYVLGAHPERVDADPGLHFFEDGAWRTWKPQ